MYIKCFSGRPFSLVQTVLFLAEFANCARTRHKIENLFDQLWKLYLHLAVRKKLEVKTCASLVLDGSWYETEAWLWNLFQAHMHFLFEGTDRERERKRENDLPFSVHFLNGYKGWS